MHELVVDNKIHKSQMLHHIPICYGVSTMLTRAVPYWDVQGAEE